MVGFLFKYWDVITFYTLAVILLYVFRSKFEFQGIIALFKTKFGLNFMTNTGKKHPVFWHRLGMLSIILGYLGMLFITLYLFYGLYTLIFVPNAPPVLSPVIPGVKIPGVPIIFPLWYTLLGLFFAVIVHEACHGIFAAAYNIKIKSSGFAFIGPLPGAFVEPDEKTLMKRPKRQQLAVFSGGPFANVVLAIVAFICMLGISTIAGSLVNEQGVLITSIQNNSGAATAAIPPNATITAINNQPIMNTFELSAALTKYAPGDIINVTVDGKDYSVTLGQNPTKETKAYLGVLGVQTKSEIKNESLTWLYTLIIIIGSVFVWTYIISLGIGIANLLPIGPVDGGRMFLLAFTPKFSEKRAKQLWSYWSMFKLLIVLLLVVIPIIGALVTDTFGIRKLLLPAGILLLIVDGVLMTGFMLLPSIIARRLKWPITVFNVILIAAALCTWFYKETALYVIIAFAAVALLWSIIRRLIWLTGLFLALLIVAYMWLPREISLYVIFAFVALALLWSILLTWTMLSKDGSS